MHLENRSCPCGSSGARCERPHEETLHRGKVSAQRAATLGPHQLFHLYPALWQPTGQRNMAAEEGSSCSQTQPTGWTEEVKGGKTRPDNSPHRPSLAQAS